LPATKIYLPEGDKFIYCIKIRKGTSRKGMPKASKEAVAYHCR